MRETEPPRGTVMARRCNASSKGRWTEAARTSGSSSGCRSSSRRVHRVAGAGSMGGWRRFEQQRLSVVVSTCGATVAIVTILKCGLVCI